MAKTNESFAKDCQIDPSKDHQALQGISKEPDIKPARRGVLDMWKKFGNDTSMHGLGRAVNSTRIWKKVVWSLLVVAAATMASRNLYKTLEDYFSYPVSTTVSLNTRRELEFPAVTVCNLNAYRHSYLKKEIQDGLKESIRRGDSVLKQLETFNILFNKHYDVFNLPEEISHSLSDMLIDCVFDLFPCNVDDFIRVSDIKNGDCFTINYNASWQWKTYRAGNRNGLIMEFNIGQNEYLPITPAAGLKVQIHSPKVMPFPHEDGVVVPPGVSTNIGLRKIRVERQIPPWGSCIKAEDADTDDINMFRAYDIGYSQAACEKTCYQSVVVNTCSCCDINYPCLTTPNGTFVRDCDESVEEDRECVKFIRLDYFSGFLYCMERCRPSCHETIYKTSSSVASWPSDQYLDNLLQKAAKHKLSMNTSGLAQPYTHFSKEDLATDFVRIEIHYETLSEESIIATPAFTWNKLLSDLGGQLGLWMGFSLMTAVEFLELGWDFLGKIFCKFPERQAKC